MPPDPLPDFIPDVGGKPARADLPNFIPDRKPDTRPLANRPDDTDIGGALKNFGTSIIKGLPHVPSVANPVFANDMQNLTEYLAMRAQSAITGKPMEELQKNVAAKKKWIESQRPSWAPNASVTDSGYSGEKGIAPILEKTGEYEPQSTAGKIGSSVVQAGASMGPGAVKGIVQRVLTGGFAGGAGEAATEYTGDPLVGIVAGGAAPVGAGKVASVVRKSARPYLPSQRQGMADELMLQNTRDPKTAIEKLSEPNTDVSKPSTAEVTMDEGHVIADKLAKARSSEYQQQAKTRESGQNTARRGVISSLANPNADPVAVSDAFRKFSSDVEAEHAKTVGDLETKAKQNAAGIQGADMNDVGGGLREQIGEANAKRRQYFKRAYDSLDPEGKLNLLSSPVADARESILGRANRDLEPESKLAQSALDKAGALDEVVPFNRMRALDESLTKLMAEARRNADPGYRDIVELKGAVKDSINKAAENQIKHEAEAVARGEMNPEDTFAHKLSQQVDAYYADKSHESSATGTGQNASVRPRGVSGSSGPGGGPGSAPGSEGLPRPNLDPETAQRLAATNKEYGEFRSLFGAEPLAGALKTTGFKDQFKVPDAKVAEKAFPAGDAGYEGTARFLEASRDPQTLADIKTIAVSRLRDMMKGDTLTPDVLDAWRKKYGPALKTIDKASPGFSDNFNNAASSTKALNRAMADQKDAVAAAQKGVAAKFLGLTDVDDVRALVGTTMSSKTSAQQVGELMNRLKGNDDAIAGVRKAAVDWLLNTSSKMGVTPANENLLSTDRVVKFVRDHPNTIEKIFGEDGLDYLKKVSDDMQRTQKLLTAQSTAGSDTASKMLGKMISEAEDHAQRGSLSTGDALNLVAVGEVFHGEPFTALKIKALQAAVEKAQNFISHRRGAGIAEVSRMFMEGLDNPEIAKAMLARATNPDGSVNSAAFARLASLLGMSLQAEEAERKGRAEGGKVEKPTIDYAAKAAQLLRLAEKAKKEHGQSTKSLLKYPDQIIAGALRLANKDV